MRVAMVSPYDLAVPGGVQGQVLGLSHALRGLGHEVMTVAPGVVGTFSDERVTVGPATRVRANGSVAPISVSPAAAWRAGRVIAGSGADIVHLHEPLAPVINYGCLVAARAPIVGTFHRNGKSALYGALRPAVRGVARRLAACCAVSDAARDNVAPFAGRRIEVLFNGVDLDALATPHPVATTAPTVLFVGRHEPRKGLAVLLEAFTKLRRPAVLWVLGEGPTTAELKDRFPPSDQLHWLGALNDEEKAARLAGADVLCAPSIGGESFGIVLLEAMATRCAVVASDIDGYREAAGGLAGLVPPGNVPALAIALDEALVAASAGTGRSAPAALESARSHADRWSMARLAEHYVEIYARVLAEGGKHRGGPASPVA
ncbi:MAG: glycosyltransferase family 4 protein [Acidimicrobiales bacterium]